MLTNAAFIRPQIQQEQL